MKKNLKTNTQIKKAFDEMMKKQASDVQENKLNISTMKNNSRNKEDLK